MGYNVGELKGIWEIEAARTREEDRRDYERELAGIDIGRDARFHGTEFVEERLQGRSGASNSQRSAQQQYASRLQAMLANDAGYARLHADTMRALGDAEVTTDRAIAKAQKALEEAQQHLEQTLSRAAKLPDGTRVFRDARGNVWNERGRHVSDADAASLEWRGDEPAYEQFLEESESVKDRLTRLDALQGYRVDTIGGIRDRMTDEDNPPSTGEMQRYRQQINEGMASLRVEEHVTNDVAPAASAVANLAIPDLS